MKPITVGRWRMAAALVVLILIACACLDRRIVAREASAREHLGAARVQLQRAASRRATLIAAPARLAAMSQSIEALSLSILEAAAGAAALPGVTELDYRLSTDAGVISTLRLAVRARVAHEQALLGLLGAFDNAAPMRPHRLAGCRVLRGELGLIIDCAIDWSWWSPG